MIIDVTRKFITYIYIAKDIPTRVPKNARFQRSENPFKTRGK